MEAKYGKSISSRNSNDAKEAKKDAIDAKPSSSNAPKKTQDQHHHHHPHHPVVKLSRPPLPFLFALFLNQFYINLIVLVPRQVGIYIIRQRFLPQDDPAAQLTAGVKYGTLMSANNFAQLASSYFWGWASDATGRKPLLLLSNVVSGAASAWFVSTRTFGQGVASRALSGCFMCSGVVMKAMIGLHYTKQGQAIAMAWRTLGAGVGQIATPLIIAALSDPCKLYAGGALGRAAACKEGGFLRDDPFVLCGFFTVFIGVIATLTNWFLVPMDPPKEWATRLRAKVRLLLLRGKEKKEEVEAPVVAGGAATAAAGTAGAASAADDAAADDDASSSSSSSSSSDDEDGPGLLLGEDALTSLLSVLSLPPQPVPHRHRSRHLLQGAPPSAAVAAPAFATDVETGGSSSGGGGGGGSGASAVPARPRGGRLPAVPSSVFLAHSQSQDEGPSAPREAALGEGRGGGKVPQQQQQQSRRSSCRPSIFSGRSGGAGGRRSSSASAQSAFSRRLSAAATSFGVLAIAAGEYGNTINDVDAARTATAVARQQNALRRRASAASAASAATPGGAISGALSSTKPSTALSPRKTTTKEKDEGKEDAAADVEKAAAAATATASAEAEAKAATPAAAAAAVPWYRYRPALVAVFAFATTTMLNESVLDLYQFYATSTPCRSPGGPPVANAGLCLDVTKTSLTVAVGGAGVVAFSILAYPPLQRRFGVAFCCRFGLAVGALTCLALAAAKLALPLGAAALLAALVAAQLLWGVGFSATSTASMIMVNLSSPPGQVGAVNGAANLLMSASRILGPYIVGVSWDAVQKSYSLDQWFPFGLFAGLFTATLAAYVLLGVSDEGLD